MTRLSLLSLLDRELPLQALLSEGHHKPLAYVDSIFGGYCLVITAMATLAWFSDKGSFRTVAVFVSFIIANFLVSQISIRVRKPFFVEIGRAIVGAVIAPIAYLFTENPFSQWWPGFMIMCLGGNIILGLLSGNPFWGRLLVIYYLVLLFLSECFATAQHNWYTFSVNAGAVGMVGFLFAEIVSLLGMTLAMERQQKQQIEKLMLNILPRDIATILQREQRTIADEYQIASILFADIQNFTPLSTQMTPVELVDLLNNVFSDFDNLVEDYGVEKIKTIGDCYMIAAGVPQPRSDHAQILVSLALAMQHHVATHTFHEKQLAFRIGINSGPLVAGVIGRKKFIYDLWGDTVNTASRMESHGVAGKIQITEVTYQLIQNDFECEPRGSIPIKGKGDMKVWYVLGPKTRESARALS